jgi:L-threonylcarbamoyladenylate synthase
MTLILPRTDLATDFITGGQNNVGLRIPAQPIALALLKKFEDLGGEGVAAPSANKFGAVSPTTAEAVSEELSENLEDNDLILDGGQCLVGIESSIIDCTGIAPKVLRPGAITEEMIEKISGKACSTPDFQSVPRTPGMMESHYSPKATIVINGVTKPGDGFIALSNIKTPDGAIRLISPANEEMFAQMLYEGFRTADKNKLRKVIIIPPRGIGLVEAINDRINRAAVPIHTLGK